MTKWIACALLLVGSSGCYTSNLGPVVTEVHMNGDKLRFTRCDLVFSQSSILPSSLDLQNCVNDTGKSAPAEAPIKP